MDIFLVYSDAWILDYDVKTGIWAFVVVYWDFDKSFLGEFNRVPYQIDKYLFESPFISK